MANGFYKSEIEHAVYSIRGYYVPTPHEDITGKQEAAFERARAESIAAYRKMIAALESVTFDQFTKTRQQPWQTPAKKEASQE